MHNACMPEFHEFGKIYRLFRDVIVTEKVDGTNAAIGISLDVPYGYGDGEVVGPGIVVNTAMAHADDPDLRVGWAPVYVYAQSRKKIIMPGKSTDNFGFAGWVRDHAEELAAGLGEGLHFGEWWGLGIQRGYGLDEKRFSLFNCQRWAGTPIVESGLVHVVPTVGVDDTLDTNRVRDAAELLRARGSYAAPGFMSPEGLVIHHRQSGWNFKYTIDDGDAHKERGLVRGIELPEPVAVAA